MTTTVEAPEQHPVAATVQRGLQLVRRDRVLQVALAMILLQLVVRGWGIYGTWFILDDFNFVSRMFYDGPDPYTASRSYLGHVQPALMYLSWFNQKVAPWEWWLPATELLVLQALADLALVRLLVTMFGRRPGILPPLALFLFTVFTLEPALWWCVGGPLLPTEIALFMGLAAHVTYLRSGELRHAVVANAWVVGGLLFNERAALVYLVLGIVTLCWFSEGYGWARIASAVRGRGAALAVYAGTGAAYTLLYLRIGRDSSYANSLGYPTYDVVKNLVVDATVPALVGGPLEWETDGIFSYAAPGDAVVLGSFVAVALILNELLRHRRFAARALVLPLVFLLIDAVLVLAARAGAVGPGVVLDYRYESELAAICAIALAAMAMPIAGATASSRRRSSSELLDHPRRVTAVVVVVVALSMVSTVQFITTWHGDTRGKDWMQAVISTLDAAPGPVALVDRPVPDFVLHRLNYPEDLASRVLVEQANADWATVNTDTLQTIDDSGRILPVLVPRAQGAVPGPVAGCGYRVDAEPLTIALDAPATDPDQWLRIGYLANEASPVRITLGDRTVTTTVQPGVHALFVRGGSSFDSVQLSGLSGSTFLCTDDVTVGVPAPLDPEGASTS